MRRNLVGFELEEAWEGATEVLKEGEEEDMKDWGCALTMEGKFVARWEYVCMFYVFIFRG